MEDYEALYIYFDRNKIGVQTVENNLDVNTYIILGFLIPSQSWRMNRINSSWVWFLHHGK